MAPPLASEAEGDSSNEADDFTVPPTTPGTEDPPWLTKTGRRAMHIASGVVGWRRYEKGFWLCTLLLFLVELGCAILGAPSPQLLENAVCRKHYETAGPSVVGDDLLPPQDRCKIPEVQVQLSILLTALSTLSMLGATIVQIPMGFVVDKKGRRPALILNITGTILYWGWIAIAGCFSVFPIWSFYIAPFFLLLGGGPWATSALVYSAIHNKVTPLQRTSAFSVMQATSGIADLIGPLLGSLTMVVQIWIPFLIATIVFSLMFIPALLIKDDAINTGGVAVDDQDSQESDPLLGDADSHTSPPDHGSADLENMAAGTLLRTKLAIFATGLGSFFLFNVAKDSVNYLIPWISFRFNETMARASLLFSLRAFVSLFMYFVLLPMASSWLTASRNLHASTKDLILSLAGIALSAAGALLMAVAPNILALSLGFVVLVLGSGATITLRTFLASHVGAAFAGRLFTMISTTGTVGSLVGMPLMGAAYAFGIVNHLDAVALPFLVSAISYLIVVLLLVYFWINN